MPLATNEHPFVAFKLLEDTVGFPVPNPQVAGSIARDDVMSIRRKSELASIACNEVSEESFLFVHPELVLGAHNQDLIVHGLCNNPRICWVVRQDRHRMEVGLSNFFDLHWYAVFPHPQGFVVRGGDESSAFIDEFNRIDGPQVIVVFLYCVARPYVPLVHPIVGAAGEEVVLVALLGMVLDTVYHFPIREPLDALARLRVPEFDGPVKRCAKELAAVIVELDIPYTPRVAVERPKATPFVVEIVQLDRSIEIGRNEDVAVAWEEADGIHTVDRMILVLRLTDDSLSGETWFAVLFL